MTLGTRIQEHRKKAGLSQEKLAELVGVSRQAVAKWEKDQSTPTTENLLCLAGIFGTTVDQLVGLQPPQEPPTDEGALAAEVYARWQAAEEEKRTARRAHLRQNMRAALLAGGIFLLAYLLGRLAWGERAQATFLGWLLGSDSTCYLFGWLTHNRLWWICMALSVLAALLGRFRLAWVAGGSFFVGFALGEQFGAFPEGAPWGNGHYGWAIWALSCIFGLGMGLWAERLYRKEAPEKLHRLWTAVYGVGMVLIIVFVKSQMIVPTGH